MSTMGNAKGLQGLVLRLMFETSMLGRCAQCFPSTCDEKDYG